MDHGSLFEGWYYIQSHCLYIYAKVLDETWGNLKRPIDMRMEYERWKGPDGDFFSNIRTQTLESPVQTLYKLWPTQISLISNQEGTNIRFIAAVVTRGEEHGRTPPIGRVQNQ